MVYKVIFKGSNKIEKEKLSLTFKEISFNSTLKIPNNYLKELKKKKNQQIITFQNIDAVLKFGSDSSIPNFNYYHVVLFLHKKRRYGFLIGNLIQKGDIIIGVWPFNRELTQDSLKNLINTYEDLIDNPQNYQEICIIN